jgi:N-acetylglucosaminyl-diphospho-decaprenol L-rhamnosyltransferase
LSRENPTGRPDLSVVIVSYQVRELLDRCLNSLLNLKSALSLQVFVVDNASTDDTVAWVRDRFSWVNLVANSENRGFSAANNQALKEAAGRHLMLLNPDTVVPAAQPNALEKLVAFMDSHPRAGACGPLLRYPDGSLQHSAFRYPSLAQIYCDLFPVNWRLLESHLNGRYPRKLYEAGQPFEIDHPLGAAFLVRREAAGDVGWLDEEFFIYAEEIDWARRLHSSGWEIWCVPAAEILHHEAQSTRQLRDQMLIELWRARFRLFRKHYTRAFNLAAGVVVRAGMRRAATLAREGFSQGQISENELQKQLEAFRKVEQMSRLAN